MEVISVIGYPLSVFVQCVLKTDEIFRDSCLVENLQKTACGGSVLSTGCVVLFFVRCKREMHSDLKKHLVSLRIKCCCLGTGIILMLVAK